MELEQLLRGYLGKLTDSLVIVEDLDQTIIKRIPLLLKASYRLVKARFFGLELMLALRLPAAAGLLPSQYAAHAKLLRSIIGQEVVLVLPELSSTSRARLLRQNVAFIVPHKQMFIPSKGAIDLREYAARARVVTADKLPWAAQAILIYHLAKRQIEGIPLMTLAGQSGYSAMTITNVADDLLRFNLCEIKTAGKNKHLHFPLPSRALWEKALPHLRSPVQRTVWVRWQQKPKSCLIAGLSALSSLSNLADDKLPTLAIDERAFKKTSEDMEQCCDPQDAQARLERWRYDPRIIAQSDSVDKFSLYLSLIKTHDERVQSALESILEDLQW